MSVNYVFQNYFWRLLLIVFVVLGKIPWEFFLKQQKQLAANAKNNFERHT